MTGKMSRNNKLETLAEKISGVLNSTPLNQDPEDDYVDGTHAQVVDSTRQEEADLERDVKEISKSKLVQFLEVGERYAGKRSAREDLMDSDENVSNSSHSFETEIEAGRLRHHSTTKRDYSE